MVEPKPEKGYLTDFAAYQDQWIFYVCDDIGGCGYARFLNNQYIEHKWCVDIYGPPINDWDYFIWSRPRQNISRSEILEFIKDNYPEQFVWCLFHPEYFQ